MPVTIEELTFAPGKGMAPYDAVEALYVDVTGMNVGDRSYMFVEAEEHENVLYHRCEIAQPGHFLSMREDTVLTQIIPRFEAQGGVTLRRRGETDTLHVPEVEFSKDNLVDVSVWRWNGQALDQGDDAAEWGSDIIGRPVRLVAYTHARPRWVENRPMLGRVAFADAYPFTVGSTQSLDLVNDKLRVAGQGEIAATRPRVSILLGGLALPNAAELPEDVFPEDYVEAFRVTSNGLVAVFKRIKACGRCPVPNTNEITGKRKGAPVTKALGQLGRNGHHADQARYGDSPQLFWTQNFTVDPPASMPPNETFKVERGAEVEVIYSDDTNWQK